MPNEIGDKTTRQVLYMILAILESMNLQLHDLRKDRGLTRNAK